MANEMSIIQAGIANANKIKSLDDEGVQRDDDEFESPDGAVGITLGHDDFLASQGDFAVQIQHDAVIRSECHCEAMGRPTATTWRYPMMVFSVIKYDAGEEKAKIDKIRADDQKGLEVFKLPGRDWRGFSYKPLFKPLTMLTEESHKQRGGTSAVSSVSYSMVSSVAEVISSFYLEKGYLYDPDSLDDPGMLHGSHRYVLQKAASTGPIISSIILYVNEQELKVSLNDQFRERHPHLPPSLTLSRIRNLKKKALVFCLSIGIELSTVAIAVISFERLCMKNLVTKANRKLSMAVSLVLALKVNENEQSSNYRKRFDQLMNFFDCEWDLSKKDVFEAEFGAYVHLGFSLHVPYPHIYLVYTRLLKLVNMSSKSYLGEVMNELYVQDIFVLERARETNTQMQIRERAQSIAESELAAASQLQLEQGHAKLKLKEEPLPTGAATNFNGTSSDVSSTTVTMSSKSQFSIMNFFDKDDHNRKRSSTVTIAPTVGSKEDGDDIQVTHASSQSHFSVSEEVNDATTEGGIPTPSNNKGKSFYTTTGLKTLTRNLKKLPNPFLSPASSSLASDNLSVHTEEQADSVTDNALNLDMGVLAEEKSEVIVRCKTV